MNPIQVECRAANQACGLRLQRFREHGGFSVSEMAGRCLLPYNQYRDLERGSRKFTANVFVELALRIKVDPNYLMGLTEFAFDPSPDVPFFE